MIARRDWFVMAIAFLGAACAHAPVERGAGDAHLTRRIPIGFGIALPAGEAIHGLPTDQRYRFVSPDSLVRGATPADAASASMMGGYRERMAVVLQSRGWRESADSADYEIAVFVAERPAVRSEVREELIVSSAESGLPRCDASRGGDQPRCTNQKGRTRQVRVSVPYTQYRYYHIMRRRSDGAVTYWVHPDASVDVSGVVARDLMRLLLTPEG